MIESYIRFQQLLDKKLIKSFNKKLNDVINDYTFLYVNKFLYEKENQDIYQKLEQSNVVIVNQSNKLSFRGENQYFLIGFYRIVMIIDQSSLSFLSELFRSKSELKIIFLSSTKTNFDKNISIKYDEIINDFNFETEIENFNDKFNLQGLLNLDLNRIWEIIKPCITGYLIKQGYSNSFIKRINHYNSFFKSQEEIAISDEDFIILRILNVSNSKLSLIYHIEKESRV